MASKNNGKTHQEDVPQITARIDRMVDLSGSKVKAIASATIGGVFAVHGIRVIDSQKGLFVQMPQSSYEKDGQKKYSDLFHAVTADARECMINAVMNAYDQELGEVEGVDEEEELPLSPGM